MPWNRKSRRAPSQMTARVRALTRYKQFLALWKEADPAISIFKAAKAEYGKTALELAFNGRSFSK